MIIFSVLLVVLLSAPVFAQSEWEHYVFEGGEGANHILTMCEDIYGNIWMSTAEIIRKYDGNQWTPVTQINDFTNPSALEMAASPNGDVWAITGYGIAKYSGGIWSIEREYKSNCNAIAVDSNGDVWLGYSTAMQWLWRFDGESWTGYSEINGVSYNQVFEIETSDVGDIWVATLYGLFKSHVDSLDTWEQYTEDDVLLSNNI